MPSIFYTKLVDTLGVYTGKEKAVGVIERQIKHAANGPDTFGPSDLKSILNFVTAAAKLYVADAAKRDEMLKRLESLAA